MTIEKLDMQTSDMTDVNVARIAALFPNVVTEGKDESGRITRLVDFDALKQELSGDIAEGPQERYRLDWPGKREAMLAANTPITKTLRPAQGESIDFDNTQNLFIEGDNLDALKLLQETYLAKVKMIYIDPPYNTGKDFIYRDNFTGDKNDYLEGSGQVDEAAGKLVANSESNGRYHSDWLSMMYPRLKLARNLLRDDGVVFISIDDNEQAALKKICSEIFGANNFVCSLIWKRRQIVDSRNKTNASVDHEYILVFARNITKYALLGAEISKKKYSNPDNDPRGPWMSNNMLGLAPASQRPNLHYPITDPKTGLTYSCSPDSGWRYSHSTMSKKIDENRILFPSKPEGRPREKTFLNELSTDRTGYSSILDKNIGFNLHGTREVRELLGEKYFDFPKPIRFLEELIEQSGCLDGDIILDFFAGSGSTAHAAMSFCSSKNISLSCIQVQLPEPTDIKSEAHRAGFKNIAEISKERIRRAGKAILKENPNQVGKLDVGFRVLKTDSSNMNDVYYSPSDLAQSNLLDTVEHIKLGRTFEDLLFQVMLDWGVDLSLPITRETIEGKAVYWVGENDLAACFEMKITESLLKAMATRKPLRAVFRDDGFSTDDLKINAGQLFKQMTDGHTDMKVI